MPFTFAVVSGVVCRKFFHLQKSDYKKCLSAMRECFMPIAKCSRLSKDDHLLTEAKVLESDVFMHQCMAESIQARAIGTLKQLALFILRKGSYTSGHFI